MMMRGLIAAQARVVEPEPLHHAGREVLDHDVALRDQRPSQLAGALLLQVEGDAALAGFSSSQAEVAAARGRRVWLDSTLMTSAPSAARYLVQIGPVRPS